MNRLRPGAARPNQVGSADVHTRLPPWHHRARHALGHSIKLRLVAAFLLLATAMTFVIIGGAREAFSMGWREAARPLLADYVDRLAVDIAPDGRPRIERAQALTERLPLTVTISGPVVNWRSHPEAIRPVAPEAQDVTEAPPGAEPGGLHREWQRWLVRATADGHRIAFGINDTWLEHHPRLLVYALAALLGLTLLAYLYVRRLLRPLDDIGAGARRFGAGDFSRPITVRHALQPDELGLLATTINTMGRDIHQMLEAKRALLLAISHELRSPLTRARLHTELLPDHDEVAPQREALRRDLQEMNRLITDLLESERLSSPHGALQREPVAMKALAQEVIAEVQARHAEAVPIVLNVASNLPALALDPTRVRLLLRNLLDNALRHGSGAGQAPELSLRAAPCALQGLEITVRDFGPGVPDDQLTKLAEPFYRPDSARTRSAGGVGLGLTLCKLVARAHGGTFEVRNALPGLAITVTLPGG